MRSRSPGRRPRNRATRRSCAIADREVFAYEGGGRDPFMSLLKSGDVRR